MEKKEVFLDAVKKFYENCDGNNSNLQWEHCYKVFYEARKNPDPDIDYLSLHLAFYLASWGMYRGSSFLKAYDHKIHIEVVKKVLEEKWNPLYAIKVDEYNEDNKVLLGEIYSEISNIYWKLRRKVEEEESKHHVKSPISPILVTKVLLGTLGCVPAYDCYFELGLKKFRYSPHSIQRNSVEENVEALKKSINTLVTFYSKNNEDFEEVRSNLRSKTTKLKYPQMKMIDMGFWQIGCKVLNPDDSN